MAPQFKGRNGSLLRRLREWNGPGQQVLAGAGLAGDQDAGVGPGHALDQVVDGLHGRRCADQRPEAAQLAQLAAQRSDLNPSSPACASGWPGPS